MINMSIYKTVYIKRSSQPQQAVVFIKNLCAAIPLYYFYGRIRGGASQHPILHCHISGLSPIGLLGDH
jgi:hypothetical protein